MICLDILVILIYSATWSASSNVSGNGNNQDQENQDQDNQNQDQAQDQDNQGGNLVPVTSATPLIAVAPTPQNGYGSSLVKVNS